uniref:uncharacterized protein LOC120334060 n=1 Tax=Styela clava TaxID=7725 RepID=UPI001939B3D5|nr:uncharacterized protein LOC120334060 [Styela clava]
MLRFIRKRVRSKASNLGDDVEVYSKRVRSKASDHKDNVEVYSKRRKQKLYQKSERILTNQTQGLMTPIATLSLEHCSWADTDRWVVATYSVISLHPLILRRMQRI